MSEAKTRAEARKKKILERGSDRMAIATGQKTTTSGSNSWRRKKSSLSVPEDSVKDAVPAETRQDSHENEKLVDTSEKSHAVEVLDVTGVKETPLLIQETPTVCKDSDSLLDEILADIDMTTLSSEDEHHAKAKATMRVLSATKNYTPVEREKAKAKRKALEEEIVRQTAEFDRLAEEAKSSTSPNTLSSSEEEKDRGSVTRCSSLKGATAAKLSSYEWTRVVRCTLLVVLGGCLGYWSHEDTQRLSSLHPSAVHDFLASTHNAPSSPQDLLLQEYASEKSVHSVALEIITTILPAVWREDSSYWYALLHYPVLVVFVVMLLGRLLSRTMLLDSMTNRDARQGGFLASVLDVVMGNFSGITTPLVTFFGEGCLFVLSAFLVGSLAQRMHSTPEHGNHSGEF